MSNLEPRVDSVFWIKGSLLAAVMDQAGMSERQLATALTEQMEVEVSPTKVHRWKHSYEFYVDEAVYIALGVIFQ